MSNETLVMPTPIVDEQTQRQEKSRVLNNCICRAASILVDIDREQATIDSIEIKQAERRKEFDDLSKKIRNIMAHYDVDEVICHSGHAFWIDDDGHFRSRKTTAPFQAISSEAD